MHHEKQSTVSFDNRAVECGTVNDSRLRVSNDNTSCIFDAVTAIGFRIKWEKLFWRSSWGTGSPAIIRHSNSDGSNILFLFGSPAGNNVLR
jgi:hypothetical protein